MRFGMILLGIIVGVAGYFIGGTIGLVGIALGVLLILAGLFRKKKNKMMMQADYGTGKPRFKPGQVPAINQKKIMREEQKRRKEMERFQKMRPLTDEEIRTGKRIA